MPRRVTRTVGARTDGEMLAAEAFCRERAERLEDEGPASAREAERARGWAAALRWARGGEQPRWFKGEGL